MALALAAIAVPAADLAARLEIPLPGEPAPELGRLFTPQSVPAGTYEVRVLKEGIDGAPGLVRRSLPPGFQLGTPPGAWQVEKLEALDAFGRAGTYDRARLAQLYWGRKVLVVRGPVERDGRVVGALTLFSPYPDASFTRLEPGTLAILLKTGE